MQKPKSAKVRVMVLRPFYLAGKLLAEGETAVLARTLASELAHAGKVRSLAPEEAAEAREVRKRAQEAAAQ